MHFNSNKQHNQNVLHLYVQSCARLSDEHIENVRTSYFITEQNFP